MASIETKSRSISADKKRYLKYGFVLAAASVIFMSVIGLLVHFEAIKLYPSSVNPETIKGYTARLEFTLRYQTLLAFWLMFNILVTIFGRVKAVAVNPLNDKSEQHVQAHKNILTNSYEQIVLSVFAQLIYISFASPECILKTIPLVNIIQFVGRITFFAGYPFKRSFGFFCTMIPTVLLVSYDMYKFLVFLGLH